MFDARPAPSCAPVACTPAAIPATERARWLKVGKQLYAAAREVSELDDGYAIRLPGDRDTLMVAAEHVSRDRMCCAFLRWNIRVEPEGGDLWLAMTGSPAAKALLRMTFETTDLLPRDVAMHAGLDVARRGPVQLDGVDAVAQRINGEV
ncbi:MAG: hypothetical protein OXU20_26490 [Myxococcales bacterium]|nr:hypothetical protein [Myxococcales bacterium]MDD9969647.1 hypothetical protein [Myxococcales bacterium]